MTARRGRMIVALAALAGLALHLALFWPGVLRHDAIVQYAQALTGVYDDAHPPTMAWFWRQLPGFERGALPMFAVQTGLYWGGLWMLGAAALRAGRTRLALATLACGLMPLPFGMMAIVQKDSLFAALLLAAAGLIAQARARGAGWLSALAFLALAAAAALRINGFLACVPLAVAALPAAARGTWWRYGAASLAMAALFALMLPLSGRALHPHHARFDRALVLYDLAGITEFSGDDVLPPLPVPDVVAANHRCYAARWWDSYATWGQPLCPINFASFNASVDANGLNPYRLWMSAVLRHPVAYAAHRLAHFNQHVRLLTLRQVGAPDLRASETNPWGFTTARSLPHTAAALAIKASAYTPLGWPAAWLALGCGLMLLARHCRDAVFIRALIGSGLLYGFGYLALSIGSDLRYQLWTMVAVSLGALLVAADRATVPRRQLVVALIPLAVVLAAGALWRAAVVSGIA